ncbi:hypothetical protein ASG01_15250 [Chryseobacterium sp. Leaf180]|uniref:hypothetical protein n=1 Tax=Chryseobacterium sp. Leaf180 TaxID=1736289 RepID=UPI0006FF3031|nr:hypothetical protein [Chryseobacterium sp. Leaf180]KQR94229.1 hypothetical protein ASG01_15250 [Chryseobacterium sp. Leaf180]
MKEYPYIFYPKSHPVEEKFLIAKNNKTGLSENFFENKFHKFFKKYSYKNVIIDDDRSHPFKPDYVLHIPQYNLYIDIEIDEPYSLKGEIPIHTIESKDELRNQYFLERGWGIIRFAEIQVIKFPDLCCKVISEYIRNFSCDSIWLEGFQEFDNLTVIKAWNTEQSADMAKNSYRKTYFNLLKKTRVYEPCISILVDGIYLNKEIRDTIRILKDVNKIKSFNKFVKNSLFLNQLAKYMGHFEVVKKADGTVHTEIAIYVSNHHSIESYSFDSELVEIGQYVINIFYIRTHDFISFEITDKIKDEELKQVMLIADDPAYPPLLEELNETKFILVKNGYDTHMPVHLKYAPLDQIIENSLEIKYDLY